MNKFKSAAALIRGKDRTRFALLGVFIFGFGVIGTILLIRSFAGSASLYFNPSSNNVQAGNDFTVTVRMNPDSEITALDATVSYDQSKLQVKSVDTSASGLPNNLKKDTSVAGKVNILSTVVLGSSGAEPGPTSDFEVAKITFTALPGASGTTTLTLTGEGGGGQGDETTITSQNATVNITGTSNPSPNSGSFSIEPSQASPVVNTGFGLRLYANSGANMEGGEITVNLPTGLSYSGTLDTTGSAFNPATTVTGTTAQSVHIVFVTQSKTLTGKQLVAIIPVTASTAGAKAISYTGARLVGVDDTTINTTASGSLASVTIAAAALPAPVVTIPGKTQIATTENITNLKQTFTVTNYDSGATYTVSLGGTSIPVSNGSFSIPASVRNGDHTLLIAASKNGQSGNASYTIRLRSPNINRTTCVELNDLIDVNRAYGTASKEFDLNLDGTVSLTDLLLVTTNWGGACV